MLPKPGDPLTTMDGKIVKPSGVDDAIVQEKLTAFPKIRDFVPRREYTAHEAPESDPKQMAAIASIVGLRVMGFSTSAISDFVGAPVYLVHDLLKSPSAQVAFEMLYRSVINNNAVGIHGRIASYADEAVTKVVGLMSNDKAPHIVQLKAAQDILDRAGTNAEQVFGIQDSKTTEDGLNIVIMTEDDAATKVEINIKR